MYTEKIYKKKYGFYGISELEWLVLKWKGRMSKMDNHMK